MSIVTTEAGYGAWGANTALRYVFQPDGKTTRYLGLHTSDPRTGRTPNEVVGLGYHRQPIVFSNPNGQALANINAITFDDLPAVPAIPYLAVWTDTSAGSLCGVLDISSAPLRVADAGLIRMAIGDIAFSHPG